MNNKTIFGLFFLASILLSFGFVSAYSSSSPYTVTMKWIVPQDTSFTVTLAGAETSIDFDTNIVNSSSKLVQPDSQNSVGSVPIAVVVNTGNLNLNFKVSLNATKPSWATLMADSDNNVAGSYVVTDTTEVVFATGIASGSNSSLYLWTNLTNAVAGTTERTFKINSTG